MHCECSTRGRTLRPLSPARQLVESQDIFDSHGRFSRYTPRQAGGMRCSVGAHGRHMAVRGECNAGGFEGVRGGAAGNRTRVLAIDGERSREEGIDAGVEIQRVGAAAGKVGARVDGQLASDGIMRQDGERVVQ